MSFNTAVRNRFTGVASNGDDVRVVPPLVAPAGEVGDATPMSKQDEYRGFAELIADMPAALQAVQCPGSQYGSNSINDTIALESPAAMPF
jgi:hypothetical protein